VAGNVEHRKRDAELGNAHFVALGYGMGERRDGLVSRTVDGDRIFFQQLRDTADVIGMVMGGKNRHQLELLAREILEHRPRLARIDHGGAARVGPALAQRPDIVVLECTDRDDFRHNLSEHEPAILPAERGAEV
jgi:hypothetical protein